MKAFFLICISFLLATSISAQEIYKVVVDESSMIIKGTSSIHEWESDVEEFDGAVAFNFTDGVLDNISQLELSVVTTSIKSGKRIMDGKIKDALEAKKFPTIDFTFTSMEELTGDSVSVTGNLTLVGVTKEISLTAAYQVGENGNITITGSEGIDMSEYGVAPPTAMMGTLKTGKDVDIEYLITLSKN